MLHLEYETLQELLTIMNSEPGIDSALSTLLKGIESLLPGSEGARVTLDLMLNPDKSIHLAIDVTAKNLYILYMDEHSCLPNYIPEIQGMLNKPVNIADLLILGDRHPITLRHDPDVTNGILISSALDE